MASGKPVGSFYVQLGLNTKEFQKNLRNANRELQQAFGSSAIRTSQLLAAAMAGVAVAVGAVAVASVKLAADLERQQVAFTRLMGSATAAKERLKDLQEFASKTPYTFTELVEYEKRLLALGFAASETKEMLTTIGDAASGLGLDAGGVGRMIKAFGDIRAKGYLQTQEIRQLAENGIPAFEILAQKIGVTIPQAMKMVEDRAIDATTAIAAMTEGINQRFGGMMALQAETMLGMWSTVRDEGENVMRIVGQQITESARLKDAMAALRSAAQEFRRTLEEKGFSEAFSNLLGEKAKLAITVTAGAIVGALIPAIAALKAAMLGALLPLTKAVALGASIAYLGYMMKKSWDIFKPSIELAADMFKNVFSLIKNYALQAWHEVSYAIKSGIASIIDMLANSLAGQRGLGGVAKNVALAAEQWRKSAIESAGYKDLLSTQNEEIKKQIQLIREVRKAWNTGSNRWYEQFRATVSAAKSRASSLFSGFMATKVPAASSSAISAGGGSDKTNKLAEDARRTSESIEQAWMQQTQTRAAQLDHQYRKELETLEKSKAYNKNYRRDLQMLDETFYQRRIELAKEAAEKEAQALVEVAKSRADYNKQQADDDWKSAEAYYERVKAIQDGSALEAQLQQDRQSADFASYVAHLNEKTAAFRAHLEGQRSLMEVYDQLQRDAHRTNADYMAEGYRNVYYGLTDALTNIITGAKSAGQAFKELGMQMIQMVVKWQIQKRLAAAMSKTLEAAQVASSTAMAAATAAAWAPAAAMVAAATFGASTASAAAGLASLSAMSRGLAIPGLAKGGLVTKPTLAMIGEGGESEAVIPLSKLKDFGGGGNVQINVINQSGVPVEARSQQRMDGGKMVVDLFLEGYSRNVGGIQDIVGRR